MTQRSREDECMLIVLPVLVKFWSMLEFEIEMVPFQKAVQVHLQNLKRIGRFAELPIESLTKCLVQLESQGLIYIENHGGGNIITIPPSAGNRMHKKLYEELRFLVSESSIVYPLCSQTVGFYRREVNPGRGGE